MIGRLSLAAIGLGAVIEISFSLSPNYGTH